MAMVVDTEALVAVVVVTVVVVSISSSSSCSSGSGGSSGGRSSLIEMKLKTEVVVYSKELSGLTLNFINLAKKAALIFNWLCV